MKISLKKVSCHLFIFYNPFFGIPQLLKAEFHGANFAPKSLMKGFRREFIIANFIIACAVLILIL